MKGIYCISKGCMACLTAYIIYFCTETHYEKCLKKVSRFVHEQNEQVCFLNDKLLLNRRI